MTEALQTPQAGAAADASDAQPPEAPQLTPLLTPRDGLPAVITASRDLADAAAALAAGHGPVAIDAERASGHRYGQRAYLIQLRREGSGSFLIDPVAQPDLSSIGAALDGVEWVLHAASQDLACLDEVNLRPTVGLFDTEIAARILGLPRVGLAALIAEILGYSLAKEHSAVDWSMRPLKTSWLTYAALDVELLLELAECLRERVAAAGKGMAVAQECAHVIAASQADALPKPDPWRRTSGLHKVRQRRGLAVVKNLWEARDRLARIHDVHPSRLLADTAVVAAAVALPETFDALESLNEFKTPGARRHLRTWHKAITSALAAGDDELPQPSTGNDAPPPPRTWAQRDAAAWARLEAARSAVSDIAEREQIPVENLLKPDSLRRLCWEPPGSLAQSAIELRLAEMGARPWQIEAVAGAIASSWHQN